jgi:hypothetical protein
MLKRILHASRDFGGKHISGDADNEESAKTSVENQFGRYPRIAAAQDRRVRLLALREICEHFLLNGGNLRGASNKSLVARLEFQQGFIG